jgi:hypothetical protein
VRVHGDVTAEALVPIMQVVEDAGFESAPLRLEPAGVPTPAR